MERTKYNELKLKHYLMDADYIVDILNISSRELIDLFSDRFDIYLESEYSEEEGLDVRPDYEEGFDS